MVRSRCITLVSCLLLTACGGLTADPTGSAFVTPTLAGGIFQTDGSSMSGAGLSNFSGNGYGFQVGSVDGKGLRGFSGIVQNGVVAPPPTTGSATMTGTFKLGVIGFITSSPSSASGLATTDTGALTLVADFAKGTLTGAGTGRDISSSIVLSGNRLSVDGQFSGTALTGTVSYNGVSGPLAGVVGGTEAVGAFHGHSADQVHAGGFIVN